MSLRDELHALKGSELAGKRIVLCVTGSIAALRAPEIAHELIRHSATVVAVMSPDARKIIHPNALEWATGHDVITEITGRIENVELLGEHERKSDLVLAAPATDNTISKVAHGVNDTPVTSMILTALGSSVPVIMSPAMHGVMFQQPILHGNIRTLKSLGVEFVEPVAAEGKAKIAETEDIVEAVIRRLTPKSLAGLRALVTAGPTLEPLDPIRIITNRSSGRMGVALAAEIIRRGGRVTLVYGPGTAKPPKEAETVTVKTTREMHEAVVSELKSHRPDLVVASAAAADFMPIKPFDEKVSSRGIGKLSLELKPTPKIIDDVKKISPHTFLIAFKAEHAVTDAQLIKAARRRLRESRADMVVANDVSRPGVGFDVETNEVIIVDRWNTTLKVDQASKAEVARRIMDHATQKMTQGGKDKDR